MAAVVSLAWIAERLLGAQTLLDPVAKGTPRHGLLVAVAMLVASLACRFLLQMPADRS